jgi:serine/threonine protein kinase
VQPVDDRGRLVEGLLDGRYEIWGFLGRGGFASVYQARSASLQRFEALKVLHASHGADSDFAKRFRQEARVAASLEHPSIVKIYDFGHVEGTLWYSMQFVEGPTLKQEIVKRGTFDEEATARIAVPLLDALEYSHARGVIHRDIKPDNILLDDRGRPYLLDFGIAKTGESLVKTQTGFILGSPAYLSPEQIRGQTLDGRSDVYSLGVTLYQMLAGAVPFRTENMSALARRLSEAAPRLSSRREGIHPELERIVHRALERDRNARYANAAEMRDDVEAFLAEVHPRPRGRTASTEVPSSALRPESPRAPVSALTPAPAPRPEPASQPEPPPRSEPAPRPEPAPQPEPPPRVAKPPAAPPPVSASAPARRPAWLWPASGAALVLAALGVWLLMRTPAPNGDSAPAATPHPTAVPTRVPAPAATAAPAVVPTAPRSTAVPTAVPSVRPTPALGRIRPTRAPREAPPRLTAPSRPAPTPLVARRAKIPPDVVEEATISLTPAQERECGGKVVGVSLVVGDDGQLVGKRVISPASPVCDAIALESVSRYRYKPALDESGRPVQGRFLVSIRF